MKNKNFVYFVILMIIILFVSVGYSAFTIDLNIEDISANVRVDADIRITDMVVEEIGDGASTKYEEYNVENISSEITLSNQSSYVTYKVGVTNFGNVEMVLADVTGLQENLEYEFVDYVLNDVICDINNQCSLGITKYILITIKYKDGYYDSNNINYNINLVFDFQEAPEDLTHPEVDYEGLIPVVISDNGQVTTISENDSNWYDYDNKKWANAVLVKESGTQLRSYYQSNVGEIVNQNDILAYYVWIPRFSYKIWNKISTNDTTYNTIEIVFQDIDTISSGTSVGEYLTHPAFWWDYDSDGSREAGEEIKGIWVGKFETTKGTSANVGTSSPTILPNSTSYVSQNVTNQFQTILKFSGGTLNTSTGVVTFNGSSIYGLSSNTDSHMMKNTEWGAVAYLSHSKYGINDEIRINNYYNSGHLTGCGAASDNATKVTSCSIKYGGSTSYLQSTTGNISGVFDTAGGAWDRLMGNFNSKAGSSGFSKFPSKKYYDLFTITSLSSCTFPICGGHGLTETYGWYDDLANYSNASYPWFVRGGAYDSTTEAGIFNLGRNTGYSSGLSTMRATLIIE